MCWNVALKPFLTVCGLILGPEFSVMQEALDGFDMPARMQGRVILLLIIVTSTDKLLLRECPQSVVDDHSRRSIHRL